MVLINGTNVKFLVNSVNYNGYVGSCLSNLISSMRSQISNEDIVVVQGNSSSEGVTTETDYTLVKVRHNSMEMTALIAVIDNQSNLGTLPDVWFYLHDTCDIGPNFITRLNTLDLSNDALVHWTVSNLGVYRNSTLVSNSSVIQRYKSTDNPNLQENRLNKYKCVCDKNIVYRTINCTTNLSSGSATTISTSKIYGIVKRKRLYFSELDLYKNWSNFVWPRRLDPPRFNLHP